MLGGFFYSSFWLVKKMSNVPVILCHQLKSLWKQQTMMILLSAKPEQIKRLVVPSRSLCILGQWLRLINRNGTNSLLAEFHPRTEQKRKARNMVRRVTLVLKALLQTLLAVSGLLNTAMKYLSRRMSSGIWCGLWSAAELEMRPVLARCWSAWGWTAAPT